MYRVRTIFTGVAGTPWYSNLFFSDQATGGAEAAIDAVAAFWTTCSAGIHTNVNWEVEGDVAVISPGTGEVDGVFSYASVSGSGSGGPDPLPYANQGLVRVSTSSWVGGRRINGKIFVPAPGEESSTAGVPSAGYQSRIAGAAQDLLDDADTDWVVYSRKNFIEAPVTAVSAAPYWAVLRSRRD